jgi:HrpA-like RNA helicase
MFIIDEAHKKNINIELLISMIGFFGKLNKKIKIMILSATIDEDEDSFNKFFNSFSRIRVHETK